MGESASVTGFRHSRLTGGRLIPSDLAQSVPPPAPSNHVFVTGAGFTRALVPDAPLLVGDFENDGLVAKVRGLPKASQLLEWERNQHPDGFINIERLMARLDQLMPYDLNQNAADGYRLLLTELYGNVQREKIDVVDLATDEADIERFKTRYRSVLGKIPDHRFSFDGAVPWIKIKTLADEATDPQARTPSN